MRWRHQRRSKSLPATSLTRKPYTSDATTIKPFGSNFVLYRLYRSDWKYRALFQEYGHASVPYVSHEFEECRAMRRSSDLSAPEEVVRIDTMIAGR